MLDGRSNVVIIKNIEPCWIDQSFNLTSMDFDENDFISYKTLNSKIHEFIGKVNCLNLVCLKFSVKLPLYMKIYIFYFTMAIFIPL